MVLGCIYLSNAIFKMRIQEKGVAAGLHLFPHAELTGYAFLFFLFLKHKIQMLWVNCRPK